MEDSDAKVAVLTGAGGWFRAGWDLWRAASPSDPADMEAALAVLAIPMGSATAPRGALGPTRMETAQPVIAAARGAGRLAGGRGRHGGFGEI